jgi:hypothetical protein
VVSAEAALLIVFDLARVFNASATAFSFGCIARPAQRGNHFF